MLRFLSDLASAFESGKLALVTCSVGPDISSGVGKVSTCYLFCQTWHQHWSRESEHLLRVLSYLTSPFVLRKLALFTWSVGTDISIGVGKVSTSYVFCRTWHQHWSRERKYLLLVLSDLASTLESGKLALVTCSFVPGISIEVGKVSTCYVFCRTWHQHWSRES